eukprot:3942030-Ditylum_brightwellii.AAC.1
MGKVPTASFKQRMSPLKHITYSAYTSMRFCCSLYKLVSFVKGAQTAYAYACSFLYLCAKTFSRFLMSSSFVEPTP